MKLKINNKLLELLRVPKHELHSVIKEHIDFRKKTETVPNTLINLVGWYNRFRLFLYQYDVRNVSLTGQGIGKDYLEWMTNQGYTNSYVKANFKIFLATINRLGIYHDIRTRELFRGYAKESKANEDYFLTDEEVKQLLALKVEDESERLILDKFIVSCFTGCRRSEITSVRVVDDKVLRYTSKKTKKDVLIPFNSIVRPYIEKGLYAVPLKAGLDRYSNEVLHNILKRLNWNESVTKYRLFGKRKEAYQVPRYKAITFHSGRKFFGKMLLDMDVPIYKVSQLLGHTSIETTQKYYAALSREKMMDETNDLINNF